MTINADKINSTFIKNIQDLISELKFKEQSDYSVMRKAISE